MPTTIHDIVVDLIATLPSLGIRMPDGLLELSHRLGVLPAMWDMGGCVALRPTGEIVFWVWDEEAKISVDSTPLGRNRALFQGAAKYASLLPFLPTRPTDAETCVDCKGTGKFSGLPEAFRGSSSASAAGLGGCRRAWSASNRALQRTALARRR